MHIIQPPLFDFEAFVADKSNDRLRVVLEALPAERLIATLERERWTGWKGYWVRGMWAALIAGVLNQCEYIADVARPVLDTGEIRTSGRLVASARATCRGSMP